MRKITTTKKIDEAITNNLLQITKAEVYNKTSCESGYFANALGWNYERYIKTTGYIAETGRMNPDSEIIITVYLSVCNGMSKENVERTLLFLEEE